MYSMETVLVSALAMAVVGFFAFVMVKNATSRAIAEKTIQDATVVSAQKTIDEAKNTPNPSSNSGMASNG